MKKFEAISNDIRRIIIEKAFDCGQAAHLGGALSMVDILTVLYEDFLKFRSEDPTWNERDIFILSKGHTVLGYLATLYKYGYFNKEVFDTFQTNGSKLIAHPIKHLPYGIESSNGSLGQGISYASGMALGYKKRGLSNRVYTVLGDGECNEGSVWEAAQLASELGLNNLIAVVDKNDLRNDGPTAYKNGLSLFDMWKSFGWNAIGIDGHDYSSIVAAFKNGLIHESKPTVIVASTIKGKGFSFMENNNDWHHNRITKSTYEKCIEELKEASDGN